jgi:hypothetical protein
MRAESESIPQQAQSIWICAVAVDRVEDWLCLVPDYLANCLSLAPSSLDRQNRTGIIKHAVARRRAIGETEVVAQLVRGASCDVFRRWLGDESLRSFYTACRAAAKQADCETPNELGTDADG